MNRYESFAFGSVLDLFRRHLLSRLGLATNLGKFPRRYARVETCRTAMTTPSNGDMTATHSAVRHRLSPKWMKFAPRAGVMSLIVAAGTVGMLLAGPDGESGSTPLQSPPPPVQEIVPAPAAPPQEIERAGQVIAVSQDTVTTTSVDGQVTTFRITPSTAYITPTAGSRSAAAIAVKQDVVVAGVIADGVPVATAIADRNAVGPGGPPMDYQLPT